LILAAGFSGCGKLKARDLLNKGVAAYKNAQYDAAIEISSRPRTSIPV